MSEIEDLLEMIDRRISRYGIDSLKSEIETAKNEVTDVDEGISTNFDQDFSYDNVSSSLTRFKGVLYGLSLSGTQIGMCLGELEAQVSDVKQRIAQ